MNTPSADAVAKKWSQRAGAAAGDYSNGVKDAGPKWQERTAASSKTYAAGVNAAIANDSFGKGVQRAGGGRYASQAATLGGQRYAGGVAAAQGTYQQRIAPVLSAIDSLKASAPLRGPKGDMANYSISAHFGQGLRAKKLAGWS
ncbi:MAG: hypothetical protein LAO77_23225 [Acidobacteriia bacterium]|nr:hypothetical protein [Terriglobia bacterium]